MRREYLCHFYRIYHAVCQKRGTELDYFFIMEVEASVEHALYSFYAVLLINHKESSGKLGSNILREVKFHANFIYNLAASYTKPVHEAVNGLVRDDFRRRCELQDHQHGSI